jgi:hypothetical protein
MVECLLDRGADIEARDRDGSTALILAAARWGHREVVECQLDVCPPKWAGVSEEVRHLGNSICLMIATTAPDHGGCNALAAGGTSQHRLGLDPPQSNVSSWLSPPSQT